jgi:hypothetical protein
MRILLTILFSSFVYSFYGQSIAIKNNEDEIYTKTIDTLVSMVLSKYPDVQIVICCDKYIFGKIPDVFHNQKVIKTENFRGTRKLEGAIWIKMDSNDSNKDTIAIFTTIRKQTKKQMLAWEYPSQVIDYTLFFKLCNDSLTYKLIDIEEGMFLY